MLAVLRFVVLVFWVWGAGYFLALADDAGFFAGAFAFAFRAAAGFFAVAFLAVVFLAGLFFAVPTLVFGVDLFALSGVTISTSLSRADLRRIIVEMESRALSDS